MAVVHQRSQIYVPIREISDRLDISFHFLTKILQQLTQAELMHSYKGPKGGIALSRSPEKIMLIDVVRAIDGMNLFEECVLGLPGCGVRNPCPLHDKWAHSREALRHMFENTSLSEMAENSKKMNLRLSNEFSVEELLKNST